jgi:hypothetical protein
MSRPRRPNPLARQERGLSPWPFITAILLIAFFFRFYRLVDLPLGLFFDPSINGLDSIRLMQRGGPVIFFPTNGGREAFFMFLLIPFLWLFYTTPFAIRLVTATISLLTVAGLLGFLLHLPAGSSHRRLAWLGGTALAVSYWHIAVSRLGQRPILVPLVGLALFWLFLKGWASGVRRYFILAGLFLGLAGHTYSAARLLPLILTLAILPELIRQLWQARTTPAGVAVLRQTLGNLLLFGLTAGLVYLPMAWYLITNPAQFTGRAGSVMVWNFLDTPAAILAEIGRNALRIAAFFCCRGSPNPIFGPPSYPGLPFILTPFLIIGLWVCLKQWRNLFERLVLLWWLIGLSPALIAIEAPHPWRMVVALVPTAILVGLGLSQLTLWGPRSRPSRANRFLYAALLLLLLPSPHLFRAYFLGWPASPTTQGVYDYGAIAIRDAVLAQQGKGLPLYLPLDRFNSSTLLYYLSGSYQRQASLTVDPAAGALVISPEKNEADPVWVRLYEGQATILPPLTPAGQALIQSAFSQPGVQPIRTGSGEIVARLAGLPADPAAFLEQPAQAASARFGPIRLTALHYRPELTPTTPQLPVTLYWQAEAATPHEYQVSLHLVDDQRRSFGSGDGRPNDWVYPTSFWRPAVDHIASRHLIDLGGPPLPAGRYWLAIALLDPAGNRLPLAEAVADAPDTLFTGPLKVPWPTPPAELITALSWSPPQPDGPVAFADLIQLNGVNLRQSPGQVEVSLLWETLARPERDYTVFVHLLDAADKLVAGRDTPPLAGRYPTTIWSPGELIVDEHKLPLPPELPPGDYRLGLGLYDLPSGQRLPLHFSDGRPEDSWRLILTQPIRVGAQSQ